MSKLVREEERRKREAESGGGGKRGGFLFVFSLFSFRFSLCSFGFDFVPFFVTSLAFRGFLPSSWFLFLFLPLWFWLFASLLLVAVLPAFWSPGFGSSFVSSVLTSSFVTILFAFSRLCRLSFPSCLFVISLLAWKLTLSLFIGNGQMHV